MIAGEYLVMDLGVPVRNADFLPSQRNWMKYGIVLRLYLYSFKGFYVVSGNYSRHYGIWYYRVQYFHRPPQRLNLLISSQLQVPIVRSTSTNRIAARITTYWLHPSKLQLSISLLDPNVPLPMPNVDDKSSWYVCEEYPCLVGHLVELLIGPLLKKNCCGGGTTATLQGCWLLLTGPSGNVSSAQMRTQALPTLVTMAHERTHLVVGWTYVPLIWRGVKQKHRQPQTSLH